VNIVTELINRGAFVDSGTKVCYPFAISVQICISRDKKLMMISDDHK